MAERMDPVANEGQIVESDTPEDPIIEARDLTVTFDMERGTSRVLNSVDLTLEREEILGVVGESGSGKSMLAESLLHAVVDPGELTGEVTFHPADGAEPIEVLELSETELKQFRWEYVSMVFQGAMSSFNPTMKIGEHFRETLEAHRYDMAEGMDRAHQLIRELYMDPDRVLDSYPHELSGGMKQRTLIALSLLLEPDVLVMDEPTAALDLLMQRSILSLIQDLQERYDLTIIFITHDLPLVANLADRLAVMYAFQLVETAPTDDILADAAHPYTRSLLKATPNLDAPVEMMHSIEGSSPDPVNVPAGCSYHPRCPLAKPECREGEPPMHRVDENHDSACFYWNEVETAVPLDSEIDSADAGDRTRTRSLSTSEGEPILELEDAVVEFGRDASWLDRLASEVDFLPENDAVTAVDEVSLELGENDVVALVGESGCGKTTLGKAAIGIHRPESGTVSYRGQDIWDARDEEGDVQIPFEEIRRSLQIIHQDPGSSLNPNKRVITTLSKPLTKWQPDMSRSEREARIYWMLEHVGMSPPEDYANRYPHQLSGGEKQRVALIRALLMNPDVILADEAISALDVSLRIEMMDLFLDLQEEFNTSFLFISHDLSNARYLVEKTGGRIGVMYLGELVEIGPVEEIINNPRHPYTQVLRWATPHLQESDRSDPPIRKIDIPDPVDPPGGCRFHTRCPEAREVCKERSPTGFETGASHEVSCYRVEDDHEYWDSPPITD